MSRTVVGPDRLDELRTMLRSFSSAISGRALDEFAASMTSSSDAELMHHYIQRVATTSAAMRAALSLYTMGGIGEMHCDLRPHVLRNAARSDVDVESTAPLLLWKCATEVLDVNAVRCILEFQASEPFGEFVARLRMQDFPLPFPECLTFGREEQGRRFYQLLVSDTQKLRRIQLARNYIDIDTIYGVMLGLAGKGSVPAAAALFFRAGSYDWSMFEVLRPNDDDEELTFINLAIENLRRGASANELQRIAAHNERLRNCLIE